ncbi:MAG TPA: hypothetical protein VN816_03435 [Acidimicrobiales bacterium]|nr:hypothetical protein [Acidimicrobiales bacterium]
MPDRGAVWVVSATVVGLGLVLAACGSTYSGRTLSQQVTSWATTAGFSASVSLLQGDLRRIGAAEGDRAPVSTDCNVLVYDALSANQNLPTPDPTLTTLLSTAYSIAGEAGHDCLSGAADSARDVRSATERSSARRDLIKALARFDAVTTG